MLTVGTSSRLELAFEAASQCEKVLRIVTDTALCTDHGVVVETDDTQPCGTQPIARSTRQTPSRRTVVVDLPRCGDARGPV